MSQTTHIADQVMLLSRHIKTLTESKLKNDGIGTGQLQLLMLFYQRDGEPLSQGDIVDVLKIDKANVSRNIQKLIDKKWIQSFPENSKRYGLTELGKSSKKKLGDFFLATHRDMVRDIEDEALVQTMKTLQKMISNLEDKNV